MSKLSTLKMKESIKMKKMSVISKMKRVLFSTFFFLKKAKDVSIRSILSCVSCNQRQLIIKMRLQAIVKTVIHDQFTDF